MLFNTFEFGAFLVVVYAVYAVIQRFRWPLLLWLLFVSAVFYASWQPWYLVLIVVSSLNSYVFGWLLGQDRPDKVRKWLLATTVSLDLGLLGVFKYGDFFLSSAEVGLDAVGFPMRLPRVDQALPVGISFYTFQSLSYTVDIYRRKLKPTKNLVGFATFVFFFPQLVAGPIVRASEFLPQLKQRPRLDVKAFGEGIFLILAGLAKKMILADTMSRHIVRPYFDDPTAFGAFDTVLAVWAANFQVYCDFSGYSDVAIGAALLFGFQLPVNFKRPFLSRTPMEHWRRWHITLSYFLRDYLYFPLGGSKHGPWVAAFATTMTFFLGGLWHGAGWTFAVWGLWNGVLLVTWRKFMPKPATTWVGRGLEIFATFNALCVGLIFLHVKDFQGAADSFTALFRPAFPSVELLAWPGLAALICAALLHVTPPDWKEKLQDAFGVMPVWGLAAIAVAAVSVLSLFKGLAAPFFYFQF
ncbi:MAG: MBOAT family protein [Proteobacteria bacterium]|nr:MBOAT family protein [Pseudomonadota bacterium]MCP4921587.1 MBOAT family protein [Pseudomonadota bacterium]